MLAQGPTTSAAAPLPRLSPADALGLRTVAVLALVALVVGVDTPVGSDTEPNSVLWSGSEKPTETLVVAALVVVAIVAVAVVRWVVEVVCEVVVVGTSIVDGGGALPPQISPSRQHPPLSQ